MIKDLEGANSTCGGTINMQAYYKVDADFPELEVNPNTPEHPGPTFNDVPGQ